MYRRSRCIILAAGVLALAAPAYTQTPEVDPTADALERYLGDQGLSRVLAAHLRKKLKEGPQAERLRAAERLGRLYVKMLGDAKTSDDRQQVEEYARELLKSVPESESFELRINLAKATYLKAEELAERDRLKMASPEEKLEAERVLKAVGPVFEDIAAKVNKRVEVLEKSERTGKDEDMAAVRDELTDGRRLRSLARYYAGWTAYYGALLQNTPATAAAALKDFGWLLNAVPNTPPTVDRLPKALLKYEHVARAVVGCALASSLRGNDAEAVKWIEELDAAEELPKPIRDQLFSRRIIVYAAANRWSDVDLTVHHRREPERGKPTEMLTVPEARLLAVLSLEGIQKSDAPAPSLKGLMESLAQIGLGDLIARGEVGHVLDLVSRYGTAPIGDTGFIVQYVRGLQSYEKARAAHKATGKDIESPATDVAIVNQYREAANLLALACDGADARKFVSELSKAEMKRGFALYYAGDLEAAAQRFEVAANAALAPEQKRDAMWFAIVALDHAVEGGKVSLAGARDKLAVLYLQNFPGTDNAAKLLLRQTKSDLLTDDQALTILMGVPKDSPLYEAARSQAARILYHAYRRAGAAERAFAAVRFVETAEEVVRLEQTRATRSDDKLATEAAQAVVLHVRQIADALLSAPTPDVTRVEAALDLLDLVAAARKMDLTQMEAELNYRRLQIATARNDQAQIDRWLAKLRQSGGEFSLAADRLLYKRALAMWRLAPSDAALAGQVVAHGLVVLDQASESASVTATRNSVAEAAAAVWRVSGDAMMRDRALELDRKSLAGGLRTLAILKRIAELAESKGELTEALQCWRDVLAGVASAGPEWFEARYESIRLLWATDKPSAWEAMKQHKTLHPDFGPEPWGMKLKELDKTMGSPPPPPPAPPKGGAG